MASLVHTPTGVTMEMDYRIAVGVGLIPTQTKVGVYGHNPIPAAGDDVWEGGTAYPFQTSAVALELLSSSANDTAAGTGARTVRITGLDINYNTVTEVVSMNGTSVVPTVNSYFRVNFFDLVTAGSGGTNAGDITLRVASAGATQQIMKASYGFSKTCIFTVPAGFTYTVTDFVMQVGGNGANTNITYGVTKIMNGITTINNEFNATPDAQFDRRPVLGNEVPEKSTILLRITAIGGTPSDAFASIAGILIKNTSLA